ncbi:MAG TPA: hypothetical protein VG755_09355 [Nannocystaceae bacterium]|nr:hypothetical protein [Nannocystaceae bacterium]
MAHRSGTVIAMVVLVACGPTVPVSESGSAGGDSTGNGSSSGADASVTTVASSSAGPSSSTSADDANTDAPAWFDLGPWPHLGGEQLFAIALVVDPAHPLQWLAEVRQTDLSRGASLTVELHSLSLDPGATTTPRALVGSPNFFEGTFASDGSFAIELPEITVVGAANPITGSDLTLQLVLEGVVMDDQLWCGRVSGSITSPLMLDLTGSTFAGTPAYEGSQLVGDPIVAACP